jgi:hypothetical protein
MEQKRLTKKKKKDWRGKNKKDLRKKIKTINKKK